MFAPNKTQKRIFFNYGFLEASSDEQAPACKSLHLTNLRLRQKQSCHEYVHITFSEVYQYAKTVNKYLI